MATKPVCIGLVFAHTFAYARATLRGIRRYVEARPQWLLISLPGDGQLSGALRRFRPAGIIASIATEPLAQALAAARRPVVNTAGVLPNLRLPRVGVDNIKIGRLAAEHFLQRGLRRFAYVGSPGYLFSIERGIAFRK